MLLGAGQVWVTNMIVFALAFWEPDRGGPVTRTRAPRRPLPPADFRFPQDEDHERIRGRPARCARMRRLGCHFGGSTSGRAHGGGLMES